MTLLRSQIPQFILPAHSVSGLTALLSTDCVMRFREGEVNAPVGAGVKRKVASKRPKLTLDDLKKPTGMPHVVAVLPDHFRAGFKGPGHEVHSE